MNEKDKAFELIDEYRKIYVGGTLKDGRMLYYSAAECARVLVKEIIKAEKSKKKISWRKVLKVLDDCLEYW